MTSQKRAVVHLKKVDAAASDAIDGIIEKKIEDLAKFMQSTGNGKSRLHEDILSMVEKSLFKVALRQSDNIKSKAAAYLGINRNTFQKKLVKFGIDCQKD